MNSIHGRSEELTLSLTKDDNTYLQKLFELCSMCEDLDDTKNLGILFNIFKQLGFIRIFFFFFFLISYI